MAPDACRWEVILKNTRAALTPGRSPQTLAWPQPLEPAAVRSPGSKPSSLQKVACTMPHPAPPSTRPRPIGQRRHRPDDALARQRPGQPPSRAQCAHAEVATAIPGNRDDAAALLARLPLSPGRCKFVLALILQARNWSHQSKPKGVSHKTMAERRRFCFWLFDFLRQQPPGYRLDPRSFSGRHVALVTAHWLAEAMAGRLSPATLQTYFSFLKTFTTWIDKPHLLQPIERYFPEPTLHRRSQATTQDKSWRAQGVQVEPLIDQVAAYDAHAGVALRLMHSFSLRFKECVMFRPHLDVLTGEQAARIAGRALPLDVEAGHQGSALHPHLLLHRGTKGGRPRLFPVDSPQRLAVIEQARQLARTEGASIGDPTLSLVQAMRRLRYCMERFGITRADLGVVPHGLRHQGAADDYKSMTGEAPPVAGGQPVDRETDATARRCIAQRLGHNRQGISTAYLGRSAGSPHNGPRTRPPDADKR